MEELRDYRDSLKVIIEAKLKAAMEDIHGLATKPYEDWFEKHSFFLNGKIEAYTEMLDTLTN